MPDTPFPEEVTDRAKLDFREQGEQLGVGLTEPSSLGRVGRMLIAAVQEATVWVIEFVLKNLGRLTVFIATTISRGEDRSDPVFRELAAAAVKDLTGADLGSGHAAIGRQMMDAITGGAGAVAGNQLEPSTKGAEAYMTMAMQLSLEGYLEGSITSALTAGWLDRFGELDDILANTLSINRITRRVVQPLLNARVVTPMQWHVNKQYRPELLAASAAVEAFLSGRFSSAQLIEELARQGWSDERINILVANARKRLSFADLVDQHLRGAISDADVITRAGEIGYDQATASELLTLALARRRDKWKDPIVDAAVAGYIARDIDDLELRRLVEANAPSYTEAQAIIDAAKVRRGIRVRQLSSSDERRLALKEIRSVSDYRRALERKGYDLEASIALELELRMELDARNDLAAAKRAEIEAREREEAAAAAAKQARDADLAARKALPTLAEYRRAYVRGHIDRLAFAAAIVREKVAITPADLELLLADADQARGDWLAQQERGAAARDRRPDPGLSIAQLEASTLAGILTLPEFDARLAQFGYDDDERRTLVALLGAKIEDRADARRRRDDAADAAEAKQISLPSFERAVRLGLRTRAQYAALLEQLGTPEISRALILDLLDAAIAQDVAAREARERNDPPAAARGLSLAQRRRAVIAGVLPRSAYEAALVAAAWPVDDQLVELALLDLELEEAAAARARRDQVAAELEAKRLAEEEERRRLELEAEQPPEPPTLTLNQVERAVKLGLLPPDALRAWLRERGYSDVDVETIVALVVAAVPDVRAGQQLEPRVAGELAAKGISFTDLKTAVRRGLRTLEDYAGELAARGYGADDVELLRQLLEEEIAIDLVGLRKKIAAALEKAEDAPALADVDAAFTAGELDVAGVRDVLAAFGVPRDTALVYGRLLLSFGSEE